MKYSIVVPTRNRAHLLRHALASALSVDFDDFEVVASDNCSTDATAEVMRQAAHPRLRTVRPDRSLSMVDHWEFALGQARGDWVLFLCDDDALLPQTLAVTDDLARAHEDLELIQYGALTFVYGDGIVTGGNYVDVRPGLALSGRFVSSHARLRHNFRRLNGEMPKFLNSAVKRTLIERIIGEHGRMFWNWAPDYSSGSLMLAHTERFAHIGPLLMWGENLLSYGAGSQRNPAHLLSFVRQFDGFDGKLPFSPYPELLTVANVVYDTLARVRETLGPTWAELKMDPVRFHRQLVEDVERYVEHGHPEYVPIAADLRAKLRSLRTALAFRPLESARNLAAGAPHFADKLQQSMKKRFEPRVPLERRQYGNIAEAAAAVGKLVAPPIRSAGWKTARA